ncbi:MAG: ribonuclease III [bacterium]
MSAELLPALEERIKVTFTDKDLLQQVFVHRSYLNEHRGFALGHNERLEFLGDAVLELVVTEHLYKNYPNPEGELTNWRSALVKGETLAKVALELDFPELMMLSYGEEKSGGKSKGLILANAFEALLGAMYLDQGYDVCQTFISSCVISRLADVLEQKLFIDPKSRLQEYTQEQFSITPHYTIVSEEGPDHAKQFVVGVYAGEKELGQGTGSSKQSAQIAAAANALRAVTD